MRIVNTKVNDDSYQLLCQLAKKKGLTIYEMLQGMVGVIIRYMSDKHNLTEEMEQMMSCFNHLEDWKDKFNVSDPKAVPEIASAIYFLQDSTGEKKGIEPVMVDKPFFGQWTQTYNVTEMVERFMSIVAPDIYKKLRLLGTDLDTNSVLESISKLVSIYGNDAAEQVYRELFEDANRSEYGLKPHEGSPYRRKMNKSIEDMESPLDFKPFDVEL